MIIENFKSLYIYLQARMERATTLGLFSVSCLANLGAQLDIKQDREKEFGG